MDLVGPTTVFENHLIRRGINDGNAVAVEAAKTT
jgi:hypothetical protein